MLKEMIVSIIEWAYSSPLEVKCIPLDEKCIPTYETDGAVAGDVRAYLPLLGYDDDGNEIREKIVLQPGEIYKIPLGLMLEIPPGYGGFVYARSGLSSAGGILLNGVGVIDNDYRGIIHYPMKNVSDKPITIEHLERVGQLIMFRTRPVKYAVAKELSETERGNGGFGHTGS